MRSTTGVLRRIFDVRAGEAERLFLTSTYLLLVIACYTIVKAVRDSLFVTQIGPRQLPYVYLLIAVVMGGVSYLYSRAINRIGLYALIRITSLIAIATSFLFWWSFRPDGDVVFYLLYIWVSIFGAITASEAWLLANNVFNPREARRLFAWIALGGILGGLVGGCVTRVVAVMFGTETLLVTCAGLMGVTLVMLERIRRLNVSLPAGRDAQSGTPGHIEDRSATLKEVRQSKYLTMMVVLMSAAVIVEAFIDYEYKFVARQAFASKDQLTAFFGSISAYVGVVSFLFQALLTHRILKRFGVSVAILFLPLGLLSVFVLMAVWPQLWAAAALQLIDGSLSYSINRSGMELLYVPIPSHTRNRVKAFIDMFVDRFGRAVGGLLLLILTSILYFSIPALSVVAAGFLAAWVVVGISIKGEYIRSFRANLTRKTIHPEALQIRIPDHATLAALTAALSAKEERQVLYALDLLENVHPGRWRHQLASLIQHHSPCVRARTIAALSKWNDSRFKYLVAERVYDPDLSVRAEAIYYAYVQQGEAPSTLKRFLNHSDYRLVHAAIQCIAKYEVPAGDLLDERFIERALDANRDEKEAARIAAAQALGMVWKDTEKYGAFLERLLADPSDAVVREAIRTSGRVRYARAALTLIRKLANRRLRRDARLALLRLSPSVIPILIDGLGDARMPTAIRVRIPKVLADSGRQSAADALVRSLRQVDYHVDFSVIKALNRMHLRFASVTFDQVHLRGLVHLECDDYNALRRALLVVRTHSQPHDPVAAVMVKALHERLEQKLDRIFRLLGLVYPQRDIYSSYYSLTSKPSQEASAIEFLDNFLDIELKTIVIPLIESHRSHISPEAGLSRPGDSVESTLRAIIAGRDPWLQTIALELAGRWQLHELLDLVEQALPSTEPFVAETAAAARRALTASGTLQHR